MSKIIGYDIEMTSFVSVEAPEGTNPENLMARAAKMFLERIQQGDCTLSCFQTIDPETGETFPYTPPGRVGN